MRNCFAVSDTPKEPVLSSDGNYRCIFIPQHRFDTLLARIPPVVRFGLVEFSDMGYRNIMVDELVVAVIQLMETTE